MSTRNNHEAAHSTVDAFGLSKSALSKEFIEARAEIYRHYQERRLDDDTYVAMYIDGKALMCQADDPCRRSDGARLQAVSRANRGQYRELSAQ